MKKIMVCIKRVVDYNVRVRVKPDGSGVMLDGVKMSVNPFDEIALEEALRIKERVGNIEVVAVSIGVADTQQQLRTALAMGADRAILVQTDARSGAVDGRTDLPGPGEERESRSDIPGQAGHRRRRQPDRTDAGRDLGKAAGDLRLEGRTQRRQSGRHPRNRCRSRNHRSGSARGHHRRSAVERASLCQIARHHEGQEEAARLDLAGGARRQRGRVPEDREKPTRQRSARKA